MLKTRISGICNNCNFCNMSKKNISITRSCNFTTDQESGESIAEVIKGSFKLNSTDWIEKLKSNKVDKIYEVRFKNTRKAYYENVNDMPLKVGDIVVVESSPGHDVGIVSMTGDMVSKQMRCKGFSASDIEFKKIYRKAKSYDIERWQEAIAMEHPTMIRSRILAAELNLNMKIGDVEYQGDKIKAIFYYIADVRVDFRELIKLFAEEFRVRIEMKQIGARQEAGRIGGIGSCGRELCCSTFVTNFVSVTTNSARFQDILLNPQKLAGQCGKLKCCLNYEVDSYIDARKGFPKLNAPLQTLSQDYYLMKTDIFKKEMTFSTDPHLFVNTKVLSVDTVKEIMALNKRGVKVEEIVSENIILSDEDTHDYRNVVGDDSITRFDKKVIKKPKSRNNRPDNRAPRPPKIENLNRPKTEQRIEANPPIINNTEKKMVPNQNAQPIPKGENRNNRNRVNGGNRKPNNNNINKNNRPERTDKPNRPEKKEE